MEELGSLRKASRPNVHHFATKPGASTKVHSTLQPKLWNPAGIFLNGPAQFDLHRNRIAGRTSVANVTSESYA
jgi:hypothetical protein